MEKPGSIHPTAVSEPRRRVKRQIIDARRCAAARLIEDCHVQECPERGGVNPDTAEAPRSLDLRLEG